MFPHEQYVILYVTLTTFATITKGWVVSEVLPRSNIQSYPFNVDLLGFNN